MDITEHTEGRVRGPIAKTSTVRIHDDLIQGTEEWIAARCGMLTASEMKLVVTPTFKPASNDKERAHLYELLAQRITRFVEPRYASDDMLRGHDDEVDALVLYDKHFERVERVGFITNDKWGFTLGYSPDGLVGSDGQVEIKSRRQKYQVENFITHVLDRKIPVEHMAQVQTGLLVTERLWCDFVSYSGGLPMVPVRAYPDKLIQDAIVAASQAFEERLADNLALYRDAVASSGAIPTKRVIRDIVA